MKHLDLFSGIGGFALGLQWAGGFETVAFCEIDKFCQKVLAKNFPGKPIFGDIHDLTTNALEQRGIAEIELGTAGFPCQPFSQNGNKKGIDDERFLWAELFRVVRDIQPKYLLLENVPNLLRVQKGLVFTGILYDLSSLGYAVEWAVIPASAVGAPHKRDRLFIIAYPQSQRQERGESQLQAPESWRHIEAGPGAVPTNVPDTHSRRQRRRTTQHQKAEAQTRGVFFSPTGFSLPAGGSWNDLPSPAICRSSDGIPHRMDRLKSLGNAVVPQLIQMLGQRLIEFDKELNETSA